MTRPLLFALLAGLCLMSPTRSQDGDSSPRVARVDIGWLNSAVLAVVRSYPTDGTHRFHWPKSGGWEGTTRDVVYDGHKLTSGDPQGRCYCCGITFEVYVRALLRASGERPIEGVTPELLHEARLRFFGDSKQVHERRQLVQHAFASLELGRAIEDLADAREGDFVQFWRHSGSGHQAVFINWLWKGDEIVGLTYWSSQSTTRGLGYNSERIGPDGIKADEIYVGRPGWGSD
jgi:hypothetical protein